MSKIITNNLESPSNVIKVLPNNTLQCQGNLILPIKSSTTAPTELGSLYFNSTSGTAVAVGKSVDSATSLGTESKPATSAAALIAAGILASGVYYINIPGSGAKRTYCELGNSFAGGGGWMLAMKATQGTTFNYTSSYWTTANTLNEILQLNRGDADAKFDVFNGYQASKFLAFFPDLNNGGQTSGAGSGWHWLQTGQSSTALNRFQTSQQLSGNPRGENMWSGSGFSSQGGYQSYGFNYNTSYNGAQVRWRFGWNHEGDQSSNDVGGGIGLASTWGNFSAGDRINCCPSTSGVNRAARFEIWVQ